MEPKVYRCQHCRKLYTPAELVESQTPSGQRLLTCPQDGSLVVDATIIPAGREFLQTLDRDQVAP